MKKFYCIIFDKYRSFKNPISYILKKTLVLSIIYSKCGNEDEKILKEDESIKIKNSWFDKKYITTLKIWLKKTYVKNLD